MNEDKTARERIRGFDAIDWCIVGAVAIVWVCVIGAIIVTWP
jgi:hypothetical protein